MVFVQNFTHFHKHLAHKLIEMVLQIGSYETYKILPKNKKKEEVNHVI